MFRTSGDVGSLICILVEVYMILIPLDSPLLQHISSISGQHSSQSSSQHVGVVSFTNLPSPVISGPGPQNNGPPPLSLGPEDQFCWLLALTLEPSADMLLFPFYPLH